MPALIQFVDSISATPTVRLDINDGVSWFCQSFKAPPPRLRRSMAENAMRDGGVMGSSTYENRTLELDLTLIEESSEEWAADEMQKLWRELDRPQNFIRYWPEGLGKPVFFRTFRSDVSDLEELWTTPIARNVTLEVLAEPFALGLRETLGPYTINNDPAAPSNPCYVDLPTILGDVPTPLVLWDDAASDAGRYVVATHTSTAAPLIFAQAESVTLGTDTTAPGGGPDTAMSGTGTNNYARTSFSTEADMQTRLTWTVPATAVGTFRVLAFVRAATAGVAAEFRLMCSLEDLTAYAAAGGVIPGGARFEDVGGGGVGARSVVDLGLVDLSGVRSNVGHAATPNAYSTQALHLLAARDNSSSALDWDAAVLLPAGGQSGETHPSSMLIVVELGSNPVIDGVTHSVASRTVAGDPTAGAATLSHSRGEVVGGFPEVAPGVANRLFLVRTTSTSESLVTSTTAVSAAYWPHYMHVRPVSS